MRGITSISFLFLGASLGVLAAPTTSSGDVIPSRVLDARAWVTPAPCQPQLNPPPTEQESAERFEKFAVAFLESKNLTEAFEYIDATYIVRLPYRFFHDAMCFLLTDGRKEPQPLRQRQRPRCCSRRSWSLLGHDPDHPTEKDVQGRVWMVELSVQLLWRNC